MTRVQKLSHAFPYLTKMISKRLTDHNQSFLPVHLTEFVFSLLNLREEFDVKAEQRAAKRSKPKSDHVPCPAEVYPNLPEHTVANEYAADEKPIELKIQAVPRLTIAIQI